MLITLKVEATIGRGPEAVTYTLISNAFAEPDEHDDPAWMTGTKPRDGDTGREDRVVAKLVALLGPQVVAMVAAAKAPPEPEGS